MSDSKVFMFPETGNNLDPNLMMALNNNGGFGGNNWLWILFIFLLYGGYGGYGLNRGNEAAGFLSNQISNTSGRDLLMQAINGNHEAVQALSGQLNANIGNVQNSLTTLLSSVQQVGNQIGMSALQTINAVQSGNMSLGQQIAQCCCDNKLLVTTQGYENQIATLNQTNTLQNAINQNTVNQQQGFTTTQFQAQVQTQNINNTINNGVQAIKDSTSSQTNAIMAKLDAIEDSRKDREISQLTAQLAAVNAKAEREAELAPIIKQLDQIQCHQPATVTLPNNSMVAVPNYYNNYFGSIWS